MFINTCVICRDQKTTGFSHQDAVSTFLPLETGCGFGTWDSSKCAISKGFKGLVPACPMLLQELTQYLARFRSACRGRVAQWGKPSRTSHPQPALQWLTTPVTQAELPSPATNPQNGDLANDRCFRAIGLGMVCYTSKLSDAHTKETTQLRRLNSLTAFKKVPSCWWISFLLTLDDLKENWYYCF